MEFELVELPQAPDFVPRQQNVDPRFAQRPPHDTYRRDQAVLIPDQEYGS